MRNTNFAFVEQRPCWAYLHAFSASRAGRRTPWIVQVGNHFAINSAPHHIPHVRAFDLRADPHAARAQDAAIVIGGKPLVRHIHQQLRIAIWKPHMGEPLRLRHRLQFAMTIGHTHRAHVIAFREQQFQNRLPIMQQPVGLGRDLHAFFHLQHASGKQLR